MNVVLKHKYSYEVTTGIRKVMHLIDKEGNAGASQRCFKAWLKDEI